MNKICTDIPQSKRLIELGIDVNTADMCWTNHLFNAFLSSWRIESTPPREYKDLLDRFVVRGYLIEPAWSLSALLEVLPKNYGRYTKSLYWFDDAWHCEYVDEDGAAILGTSADIALDACYKMILDLHELKLL